MGMSRQKFLNELHAQFAMPRLVVADFAERSTGRTVVDLDRLIAGDENEVYRVRLASERVVYVRISRPGMPEHKARWEAWAIEKARSGGVPVPEVLAVETIGPDEDLRPAMVMEEVPGSKLAEVLPVLSSAQRREVMRDLGRVLAKVHSVRTPGLGTPDREGVWPDPDKYRRAYINKRLAERGHLEAAGVRADEIDQAIALLGARQGASPWEEPVLCHGDIYSEHVFIDAQLRVCGVIDWGMWRGAPAVDDLGYVKMRPDLDFDAIISGYGTSPLDDRGFRDAILVSIIAYAMQDLGWHLSIGNTFAAEPNITALRQALTDISSSK